MSAEEIKRIRLKLGLSEERFAELFGLSGVAVVADIEAGAVQPANIIITMLSLLDTLPPAGANSLIDQMLDSARKNLR